jgi:hypothetical protein
MLVRGEVGELRVILKGGGWLCDEMRRFGD